MASFANPFAAMGDYRGNANSLADPEEVSFSYLTGLPDVRTLSDPQVTMVFKNLLKKDPVTRERALTDFVELLTPDYTVDDETHLAFIQIYAKFSIDVLPAIRQKAHVALDALYSSLGRRSAKHLTSSVGPWLAGTHDPDNNVSAAAQAAWKSVFPDKKALVVSKMSGALIDFITEVFTSITPTSISDMRYISKDDAEQKYYRVVKTAVDIVASDLDLEQLENEPEFLHDDSIWKFLSSKNPYLIKSILVLAHQRMPELRPAEVVQFWKNLLKGLRAAPSAVAVDLLRMVVSVTENYPDLWPQGDSIASIAQFIVNGATSPRQVWPLLFTLAVKQLPPSVGMQQESTASLLLKSMKKVVPNVVGDAEASAWGCYLALCTKPGPLKYVEHAVDAAAKRCEKTVLPALSVSLAGRFKALAKVDGIEKAVAKELDGNAGFAKVIASSGAFTAELEAAMPSLPHKAVSQIVALKPDIKVDTSAWEPSAELLDVAVYSTTVDKQEIVDRLLPAFSNLVLDKAPKLGGVHGDFSQYVDESSPASLRAAVTAHGKLISDDKAKHYLGLLVDQLSFQDEAVFELSKAITEDEAFCAPLLNENKDAIVFLEDSQSRSAAKILEKLSSKDTVDFVLADIRKGIEINDVDMLVSRALKLASNYEAIQKLLFCHEEWLENSALFVEHTSQWIYEVDCWYLAEFEEVSGWSPTFSRALYLYHLFEQFSEQLEPTDYKKVLLELCLVASACVGHVFVDKTTDLTDLLKDYLAEFENRAMDIQALNRTLWDLSSGKDAKAFHAVQLCSHFMDEDRLVELAADSRASFTAPSLRGALIAQNGALKAVPWYDRYQAELVHDLNLLTMPMADVSVASESLQNKLLSKIMNINGAELIEALKLLQQLDYYPTLELVKYALEGNLESQFAILQMIDPGEYVQEIAEAACLLKPESSQFDRQVHGLYLKHAKGALLEHADVQIGALYNLVEMESHTLPWIGYCYLHANTVASYRAQLLGSNLEDTALSPHLQRLMRDPEQQDNEAVWFLFLAKVTQYVDVCNSIDRKVRSAMSVFGDWDEFLKHMLAFIAGELQSASRSALAEIMAEDIPSQGGLPLAMHLLYMLSMSLGAVVRSWYREVRDRELLKSIDDAIQLCVLPAVLRSVGNTAREMREHGQLEGTSVSEQLREFRALVELEDHTVDVVIRLPPLYPAKSASVEIKNLAGVPEAKRRAWVLEAEFNVQNGAIIGAMRNLLLKLNNFLEGIEPCAICYQVVLNGKQLPNKPCTTCHNTYHGDCLFKWFNSNKSKLCPMCRTPF